MSTRLIQDLHAGISRSDWSAVERAANRLRDDVEETRNVLAGTDVSSLPHDYPLPRLAQVALSKADKQRALIDTLVKALEEIAGARWKEDGDLDDVCTVADHALAAAKEQSA